MTTAIKDIYCTRCERALKFDDAVWLELDTSTGEYTIDYVPLQQSQGYFPFGLTCAKLALVGGKW